MYCLNTLWIYTALKHGHTFRLFDSCLNTLWIYTALKQDRQQIQERLVWIPSGFTLLSNYFCDVFITVFVWIPSGFTLLSNPSDLITYIPWFEYPLDLHCSQTRTVHTNWYLCLNTLWIYTALKLHLQPVPLPVVWIPSIYTALKQIMLQWS